METNELIRQQLKSLAPEWQDLLRQLPIRSLADNLASTYKLNPEQASSLESEIILVAIGLELEKDFLVNIQAALSTDSGITTSIKNRVSESIFKPLSKFLEAKSKEIQAAEAEEREKYKHLPAELQEVILDARTEEILAALSDKYQLHVDQAGVLYDVTDQVLTGKIKARDFVAELVRTSSLSTELANKLAGDLNQQLFQPVQATLRALENQPPTVFEAKLKGLWSGNQNQSSSEILIKPQPATTATTPAKVADPYLEPLE